MTKKQLKEKIYELKKHGFQFKNFQNRRYNPYGSIGFPDLFIVTPDGWIIFVELKTDNDEPSDKQIEFRNLINDTCKYAVCVFGTRENHKRLIDTMLRKDHNNLLEAEKVVRISKVSL